MSKIALFRSCLLKLKLDIQIPSQKVFLLSLSLLFKKISTGIAPISFPGVPSAEVFFFHAAGGRGEAAAVSVLTTQLFFRSKRQSSSLAAASNFGMICFFRDRTWFLGTSKSWKRSWKDLGLVTFHKTTHAANHGNFDATPQPKRKREHFFSTYFAPMLEGSIAPIQKLAQIENHIKYCSEHNKLEVYSRNFFQYISPFSNILRHLKLLHRTDCDKKPWEEPPAPHCLSSPSMLS